MGKRLVLVFILCAIYEVIYACHTYQPPPEKSSNEKITVNNTDWSQYPDYWKYPNNWTVGHFLTDGPKTTGPTFQDEFEEFGTISPVRERPRDWPWMEPLDPLTGAPPPWYAYDKNATGRQWICYLEPFRGPCRNFVYRYAYNPYVRDCVQFIYGGCRGNFNNFYSKRDCQKACTDAPQDPCSSQTREDNDTTTSNMTKLEFWDYASWDDVPYIDKTPEDKGFWGWWFWG